MDNDKREFIERFVEVCGTNEPAKIQRLLDISYQAAKNYLQGRLPDSYVLLTLAKRTPYSINWLLTGEGEKFVAEPAPDDGFLTARQIRQLIRTECAEIIDEILTSRQKTSKNVVEIPKRVAAILLGLSLLFI